VLDQPSFKKLIMTIDCRIRILDFLIFSGLIIIKWLLYNKLSDFSKNRLEIFSNVLWF